jgi:hypothetical protein
LSELGKEVIKMKIPDDILATAKEAVLRFGYFKPSLFVEGTNGRVFTHLPFGESNDERVWIMTQAGMKLAKDGKLGDVERVIFVTEAWVGPARERYVPPSQDPDRMEVLLFNVLDAETNTQYLEMYSCVRNGQQEITDLKFVPMPEKGKTVDGNLLPAFLTGFRLYKR